MNSTKAMNVAARRLKADFPLLSKTPDSSSPPLIYLDSAATSQKPRSVIRAIAEYYETINSNVHRSIHRLGEKATAALEASRSAVAAFIDAAEPSEIIFTRGVTESMNLLASGLAKDMKPGDEIVLSVMEHHANIVPWQMAASERGLVLRFVDIDKDGNLDMEGLERMVRARTKLVSIVQVSNVLGTINPIHEIAEIAHSHGAMLAVDAAQSAPHMPLSVRELGADFLAFSGHKVLGPMGIGVLYGARERLEALAPYQGGGEMISDVSINGFTTNVIPYRFEAGTPNVEGAVGLQAAIEYTRSVGLDWIAVWTEHLAALAREGLETIPGCRVIGRPLRASGIVTFTLDGIHSHDLAAELDARGVAVRAGKHCAHPLAERLGYDSSCRASFYLYNTEEDVEALVEYMREISELGVFR